VHIPYSEAERILVEADENNDNAVSKAEFLCAYHTEAWAKFKILGNLQGKLSELQRR
jgi:hypothetical protein